MWNELVPPTAPLTRTGKIAWLMSFIDLLNIIICAFVLMFAMKAVDMKSWDKISGSFKGVFAPAPAVVVEIPDGRLNAKEETTRPALTDGLHYLDSVLRRRLAGDKVWGELKGQFDSSRKTVSYPLPMQATPDDWQRLAGVLRRWDNPLVLQVQAPATQAAAQLTAAQQPYTWLRQAGVDKLAAIEWRPDGNSGLWLCIQGN